MWWFAVTMVAQAATHAQDLTLGIQSDTNKTGTESQTKGVSAIAIRKRKMKIELLQINSKFYIRKSYTFLDISVYLCPGEDGYWCSDKNKELASFDTEEDARNTYKRITNPDIKVIERLK